MTLAFSLIRDLIVFTEFRLILVDKQGVTGKKTSYKSLPYRSISRFQWKLLVILIWMPN